MVNSAFNEPVTTKRPKPWTEPGSPEHDALMIKAMSKAGRQKIIDVVFHGEKDGYISAEHSTYEAEVILKSGNYIIGYVDAVVSNSGYDDILVEAKPHLTSVGDVIRQLKTYSDIYLNTVSYNRLVLVTYDMPSEDVLEFLTNEKITLVTFDA